MDAKTEAERRMANALAKLRDGQETLGNALIAAHAYAAECVATGPERDLADLERLARDNDGIAELRLAAWGLSVAWQPDARTFGYFPAYDSPLEEYTRAEALALLKGAKDGKPESQGRCSTP